MVVFLTNGFSPGMLKLKRNAGITVKFTEIDDKEFCDDIKNARELVNAVGHKSTIELVNSICGTKLEMNRVSVSVSSGDIILAIILTTRLEEGRVLKNDEIKEFLEMGKIKFVRVEVES